MNSRLSTLIGLPVLLAMAAPVHAQITLVMSNPGANEVGASGTSIVYAQNFDGIGASTTFTDNSTLPGWYSNKTAMTLTSGGGSSTGVMYNYGTSGGATDRSIGGQPNTNADGLIVVGVRLVNATGQTIDDVSVNYLVEQWRRDTSPNSQVTLRAQVFDAGTGSITLANGTWTQLANVTPNVTGTGGAINGNDNTFAQAATVAALGWQDGQELWLRWSITKTGGSNIHLAIDDLVVNATVIPEPATLAALFGLVVLGIALARRRRS